MNEKAIALTVFFISISLLYLARFIGRLRKLKKIKGYETEKGFILGAYFGICGFCCFDLSDWCDCFLECTCCTCAECSERCFGESYKRQQEKRADKQSDAAERKTTERKSKEQKESLAKIEHEKTERRGRIEALKESGYIATDKDRNKVIDIVSVNPKTSLSWTSNATRLPIEEIVIIIEDEEDFEIKDEYIVNNKKMKIAEKICPGCENPFESDSDFCPNCGYEFQ